MSVYLITVRNIYCVGKSCRFLMLKQLVCITTAELDGVKETCEERKKKEKKETKIKDELKQN